ncbi:MAG: MBL fold metallo-hydrolase [Bacillus sp. (in: Bacteria)]|nr:MBL fold metallo-hydrolase [Bacillus sp. (in: firmicutes)]MCM1427634.1 MBL fold metallo-hydrolase [Eubacterium sp.]
MLKYGNTNTFFVRGISSSLLIDTDYAGTLPMLYKQLKKSSIHLNDITYILATHYHPDHIGLVSELMDLGVKLLLIDTQVEYVQFSDEIFSRDKRLKYKPIDSKKAMVITCRESRDFLADMGIYGKIISTPSHSEDSISLILDDGTCIVGDLEPISYLDAYDNNSKLKNDWEHILNMEPKKILYAHANEKIIYR